MGLQPSLQSTSPAPAPSFAGGGPPNGRSILIESYVSTRQQLQRVTVLLAAMLALLVLLPEDALAEILEAAGVKLEKNTAPFTGLGTLVLCAIVCHLAGVLAQGARLSRLLGADLELALVATDKQLVEIAVADVPKETDIRRQLGGLLEAVYGFVRAAERLVSTALFWGIVFGSIWVAADRVASMPWLGLSLAWVPVVVLSASLALLALTSLRLSEYWLLRWPPALLVILLALIRPALTLLRAALCTLSFVVVRLLRIVLQRWRPERSTDGHVRTRWDLDEIERSRDLDKWWKSASHWKRLLWIVFR